MVYKNSLDNVFGMRLPNLFNPTKIEDQKFKL